MIGAIKYLDRKKPHKANIKKCVDLSEHHEAIKHNNNYNDFKVHTDRISFPPDFDSRGIAFPEQAADSDHSERESEIDVFTFEGLCFGKNTERNIGKIRRSDRLKKAAGNKGTVFPLNCNLKKTVFDKVTYNPGRKKSKSIFQEINKKYDNYINKLTHQQTTHPQESTSKSPANLTSFIDNFSEKFGSELKVKFKNDPLENYLKNILQFSKNCDMDSNKSSKDEEMKEETENEKKFLGEFQLIPKSKWVYHTPPKQRIPTAKLAESAIKPAILYSDNQNRNQLYSIKTPDIFFDTNVDSLNENAFQHEATFGEMSSKLHLALAPSATTEASTLEKGQFISLGNKRKFAVLQPITEEKTTQTETKDLDLEEQERSVAFNPIIEQPIRTKKRCNKHREQFYKCKKRDLFNNLPTCSKFAVQNQTNALEIPFTSSANTNILKENNYIPFKGNILQEFTTNKKKLKKQRDEGNTSMFFNFPNNE